MSKQIINIGLSANDHSGDPLRTAFRKVNENFTELYDKDVSTQYHLGDDTQFVDIDPDSGTVVIQSGFDTGMPVYIKGANCSDEGVGGDVIIEAGGAPLPNNGTTGVVSIAAREVTIETEGGTTTFTTGGGGAGYVTFPEVDGEQLGIQGNEIGSQPGSNGLVLTAYNGSILLATHADSQPVQIWEFDRSGTINTPLLFPLSFTAVLDVEHRTVGTGTYTGPAWEFNLEWQVSPSGQIELLSDTGPLPSLVVGYADGQTFEFTEEDHGIPNYTLTVTLYNVVQAGPAGWTANLSFSEPPVYPSTVKSLGAIKLTSNGHSIVLGTDGYLTTESIHLQGSLKGVDGNTGTTGQVLTRQSNGGAAWENATGGGGGGLSISDFGRGFTDTLDSGKITTNKLYNRPSNLALNNHFELSVDDGGTVHLPDQSIINGATLKTVSGGWAGITAGPAGHDEDSWVFVDNDGATIATKFSTDNYQWKFDNTGNLILPNGQSIGSGSLDGIKMTTDRGTVLFGNSPECVPTLLTHFHIMKDDPANVDLFLGDDNNYVKLPGDGETAYGVEIGTNGGSAYTWRFGTDGSLTLPGDETITDTKVSNWDTAYEWGDHSIAGYVTGTPWTEAGYVTGTPWTSAGYVTAEADTLDSVTTRGNTTTNDITVGDLTVSGEIKTAAGTGDVVVEANDGTARTWTFGGDGTLTLPGTGTINNPVIPGQVTNGQSITLAPAELGQTVSSVTVDKEAPPNTNWALPQIGWSITISAITVAVTNVTSDVTNAYFTFSAPITLPGTGNITFVEPSSQAPDTKSLELTPNGTTIWTFGGDGTLTFPDDSVIASYKPVTVIAQTTTAQTITDSASASVIQFVETVDTAGAFTPGTFTAPYTGYYQVNLSVYFSTTVTLLSGSFLIIDTNLDNTKQVTIFTNAFTGSYLHYSTVIPATAGDAIRVVFRNYSGGDVDISSGSRLTIHRVSIS